MTYRRDYQKIISTILFYTLLSVVSSFIQSSSRHVSFQERFLTIAGIILFFTLITILGSGMFSTLKITKDGLYSGKTFISWDNITEAKRVKGFPTNLHLKYKSGNKIKKALIPWPLKGEASFRKELSEFSPPDNALLVYVQQN